MITGGVIGFIIWCLIVIIGTGGKVAYGQYIFYLFVFVGLGSAVGFLFS